MQNCNHSLQDRVAIVTGAGKGLGKAYALHLAALGARVVVNNRATNDPAGNRSADAVVEEISALGGNAIANYDSVEKSGAGDRMVAAALQQFGRLDIVVANAGIDRGSSFHKQNMADFEAIMQINFSSVAHLLFAAWPHLRAGNYGRVLISTSSAGLYGNHGQAAYSSSKAALQGLMKSLSIEGASRGILVNSIAPYAATRMTSSHLAEQQVENLSPDTVAPVAGWLVSEQCRLTGKTFIVGANHARLAQTLETESIALGEDLQATMDKLLASPCNALPSSASAEFEDFIQTV